MSWRSTKLTWLALRWTREVQDDQPAAMLRMLASSAGWPLVLRAIGTTEHVDHFLAVPQGKAALVTEQLRVSLPGLGVDTVDPALHKAIELNQAIRLKFSNRRRPLRTDHAEDSSRAVLSALSHVGSKEQLVLQWQLGRRLAPMVVPNQTPGQHSDSWGKSLLMAPWAAPPGVDSEARSALRTKQGEPGWRAIGRIAVRAATASRRRQLLAAVLGALRTVEAPGVSLLATNDKPARTMAATMPWRWEVTINLNELAVVCGWPVGQTGNLPVAKVGSRALPAAKSIPSKGRVIGRSTWPGAERPLALSPDDSLRHLHVLGPTGVGKSTLLLNVIVEDMRQGRGLVVIEPKGDLIHDVLQRVPEHRLADVVLLDPYDETRC